MHAEDIFFRLASKRRFCGALIVCTLIFFISFFILKKYLMIKQTKIGPIKDECKGVITSLRELVIK